MTVTANAREISAADLRTALGRANLKFYIVASRAGIKPSWFSAILNERAPLSQQVAERILEAVKEK